jgi:2-oxoglutarate dehydrogenase E2 component (dihydrolipoamide succinyltransferase)
MHSLTVARSNNNDDTFVLVEWYAGDGQFVEVQQLVAAIETSKATIDIENEVAGLLHHIAGAGERYQFGKVIGYLFCDEAERQTFLSDARNQTAPEREAFTVTRVAREMMEQHGLTDADLRGLGKKLIKRSDIEELLSQQATPRQTTIELSQRQAAIAETVSRSHAAIPRAFLAMKVACDDALELLNAVSAKEDCMIGLTELLVKIIAGLQPQFPFCFGTLVDKNRFAPAEAAHIGVTIDVGKGLFVAVVRDAAARSLTELADALMEYRIKAVRNTFKEEDLSGGNFSISLNTEPDTVFVLPVILPNQTCMLSLSAVQEELFLAAEQAVATRSYVILGLAYDHRVINGYEAVQFVKAIKAQVESPAQIMSAGAIP